MITDSGKFHPDTIKKYYRYHSHIYDATRWSFLFGRKKLIDAIPKLSKAPVIVEIGCGTGQNLLKLKKRFSQSTIYGIDLSSEMLSIANRKTKSHQNIQLKHFHYGVKETTIPPADLILLSYSLTMMKGNIPKILGNLQQDLKSDGYLAVVDFHTSKFNWFRRWMEFNHVDFSGTLLPQLKSYFSPVHIEQNKAYIGLWNYFQFIGRKL